MTAMSGAAHRVAVFAATRADLFPLSPVLAALRATDRLDVTLLASGTMRNKDFGDPLSDLDLSGVDVRWVAGDLGSSAYSDQTQGGARISLEMAEALEEIRPGALVILGDRWELLYAVPPAVLLAVPIVHLHGGEVTEGAIDDRIRHSVTKLADVHCVSTESAGRRVAQLGEPAERIFVTGAPSLDRMSRVVRATDDELSALLGTQIVRPLALVTYHPVTAGGPDPAGGARAVLQSIVNTVGSAIITHPGLDRGREAVMAEIREVVRTHPTITDVNALGKHYLPVLSAADVVVGNSSSGIFEAASFGVPVVNVGDRQRGRPSGTNVIDSLEDEPSITAAIREALTDEFRRSAEQATNIYGDGCSAARVLEAIDFAMDTPLARKPFVDLPKRGESQ